MRGWLAASIAVFAFWLPAAAHAQNPQLGVNETVPAPAPIGWIEFCARHPSECDSTPARRQTVRLNANVSAILAEVNTSVNGKIKPLDDMSHWGVPERWDFPDDGYGDCEDYVLLKRRLLMQAGLPRNILLITIVRKRSGEGHAVLVVNTTAGDLVLDNLASKIKVWHETNYEFIKYQSPENQNKWVWIGPPTNVPVVGN